MPDTNEAPSATAPFGTHFGPETVAAVEALTGHIFADKDLIEAALTHSSYANERGGPERNNERLEYLGDAVLELTVSRELYLRFPEVREGELTRMRARLVNMGALARVAGELGLGPLLLLGRGEESQGGRERKAILSDVFEALLGAVFVDGGFDAAAAWVARAFEGRWPKRVDSQRAKDAKSALQEVTQKRWRERPVYSLEGSEGPEHAKVFRVRVTLPGGGSYAATGQSVKRAEQEAAEQALKDLEGQTLEGVGLESETKTNGGAGA